MIFYGGGYGTALCFSKGYFINTVFVYEFLFNGLSPLQDMPLTLIAAVFNVSAFTRPKDFVEIVIAANTIMIEKIYFILFMIYCIY